MEIIIAIILIFIAYKLFKMDELFRKLGNKEGNDRLKTTSYPVYTKYEIGYWQKEAEKADEQNEYYHKKLREQEKLEIKNHHLNKGGAEDFNPSPELVRILKELADTITDWNIADFNWKKAIEANIAVLNGKSISDAQKEYGLASRVHWFEKCEQKRKEVLENNKKEWLKNWDKILKEDDED